MYLTSPCTDESRNFHKLQSKTHASVDQRDETIQTSLAHPSESSLSHHSDDTQSNPFSFSALATPHITVSATTHPNLSNPKGTIPQPPTSSISNNPIPNSTSVNFEFSNETCTSGKKRVSNLKYFNKDNTLAFWDSYYSLDDQDSSLLAADTYDFYQTTSL